MESTSPNTTVHKMTRVTSTESFSTSSSWSMLLHESPLHLQDEIDSDEGRQEEEGDNGDVEGHGQHEQQESSRAMFVVDLSPDEESDGYEFINLNNERKWPASGATESTAFDNSSSSNGGDLQGKEIASLSVTLNYDDDGSIIHNDDNNVDTFECSREQRFRDEGDHSTACTVTNVSECIDSNTNTDEETIPSVTKVTCIANDEILAKVIQEEEDYIYALNFATDNDININTTPLAYTSDENISLLGDVDNDVDISPHAISNCKAYRGRRHIPRAPHPWSQNKSHFNTELYDNAAAYLLLDKSMSAEEALRSAGFVDCNVKDLFLQKDISQLVFNLRQNASLYNLDINALTAAHIIRMTRSVNIRHAMQIVGFTNQDIAEKKERHKILQCLAFDDVMLDSSSAKTCMKLTTSAHLLAADRSLTTFAALKHAGFDDSEADDANHQKETKRRACEIRIQTSTAYDQNLSEDELHSHKELYSRLDNAAKFFVASNHSHDSCQLSIQKAMEYTGFDHNETKNSHYLLHVRMKARFLQRTLALSPTDQDLHIKNDDETHVHDLV